MKITIGLI